MKALVDRARVHRLEAGIVIALVLVAALVRYPTLRQPIVESHGFRQTQTAYTAKVFHDEGVSLLHPELPVLGEPFEVPFEFPLFQAVASTLMARGLSSDVAMRVTALASFLTTALLVWGLTRYATRRRVAAAAALVAFLFSPHGLLWSRASLIEYMATAGAVGFAFAAILWWDTRRRWWAVAAVASGVVGFLVKPTTAAFWVLPVLGWTIGRAEWRGWRDWRNRVVAWVRATVRPRFVAIVALPFLPALAWTRHADAIKASRFATSWLTESALREWNYGTLAQRRTAANWVTVFDRVETLLAGRYFWVALAVVAIVFARRARWFWIGVAAATVLPIVVFFNLYVVHDYYLAAVSPAVAMLLGAGVGSLVARFEGSWRAPAAGVLIGAMWLVPTLWTTSSYWRVAWQDIPREGLGGEIGALTDKADRIVVLGEDWSPQLLYYADRKGLMLAHDLQSPQGAQLAHQLRYNRLYAADPVGNPLQLAREWDWIGVHGSHLYGIGDRPESVSPASAFGTSDVDRFSEISANAAPLIDAPLTITCGTPAAVPRGAEATWIRLGGTRSDTARLGVGDGRAPLPDVEVVIVPTADPAAPLSLECSGAVSVVVEAVFAGPLPGAG